MAKKSSKGLTVIVRGDNVKVRQRGTPIRVQGPRGVCRALTRVAQEINRRTGMNPLEVATLCTTLAEMGEALAGPRCSEEITLACASPGFMKHLLVQEMGPMRRARRRAAPGPLKHLYGLGATSPHRRYKSPCTPFIVAAKQMRKGGRRRTCYAIVADAREEVGDHCAKKVEYACHKPKQGKARRKFYQSMR